MSYWINVLVESTFAPTILTPFCCEISSKGVKRVVTLTLYEDGRVTFEKWKVEISVDIVCTITLLSDKLMISSK